MFRLPLSVLVFLHNQLISLQLDNHPLDRKTFIVLQDNEIVVNRVITQGEVSVTMTPIVMILACTVVSRYYDV